MVEPARGWATVAALVVAMSIASCSGKSERDGGTGGDPTGGAGQLGGTGGDDQGGTGGTGGIGGTAGAAGDGSGAIAGVGTGGGGDTNGAGSNAGGSGSGGEPAGSGGLPAGSGGTGGTLVAGTGGVSGIPPLPSCMRELFDACPMEGACTMETTATQRRTCFESGAREEWDLPVCMGLLTGERRFYGSDGALCYKAVTTSGPGCESTTETWTDGNGDPVATRTFPFAQAPFIICADGERSGCADASMCRWEGWPPAPMCEPGSCPPTP